jgi:hypothetical protein
LTSLHEYEHGAVELHFFRCTPIDAGQSPRTPYVWVKSRELAGLRFPPGNDGLLKQMLQSGVGGS